MRSHLATNTTYHNMHVHRVDLLHNVVVDGAFAPDFIARRTRL